MPRFTRFGGRGDYCRSETSESLHGLSSVWLVELCVMGVDTVNTEATETPSTENLSSGSMANLVRAHREDILRLASLHGARNVRLFGSVVRGSATADSDLDVLVDFDADRSLLDRIGLIQDLEDLLGIDVDVVTVRSVHRDLKEPILRDAQPL